MMRKFLSWPIRVHLLLLVILLALPSVTFIIYWGMLARDEAVANAKSDCLKFVNAAAGEHQAVVAGILPLLTTLALLPDVQLRNAAAINSLYSDLLKNNSEFINIGIVDKSGDLWASATPFEGKVSIADRKYFQNAVQTRMLSSGEYAISRVMKTPTMNFAYPVNNASNEVNNVIIVALNLEYVQQRFETINLPPGSSFSLLDRHGIILHRNSQDALSTELVGKTDRREELFTKMVEGPDEGTYEAIGNDGKDRLTAYKKIRLPHESQPYLYVRSSIPKASVVSKANAAMFRSMLALTSVFAVGLILALYIGKRMIVDPVTKLKEASRQLTAGPVLVNVSEHVKDGELGEFARTFDDMVEALLQKEKLQLASKAAVEEARKSLERERNLLQSVMNGAKNSHLVYLDRNFNFSRVNETYAESCGYKPEEMIGKNHFALYPDEENEAIFARVRDTGIPAEFHDRPFVFPDQPERGVTYWNWTLTPAKDDAGSVVGLIFSLFDTSERVRAEAALRENQEALRQANEQLEERVRVRTMDLQNLTEQLERSRGDLRNLASELVMAEERERKRIAGVLHDEIAQTLAAVRMRLDLLQGIPSDQKDTQTLEQAKVLVMQSLQETRALMNDLGNPLLFDVGLKTACEALANRLMERHPVRISCDIRDAYKHLNPDVKAMLYQVVRELLNNVVKHSHAQNAHVLIGMENGHFRVKVTDDGMGFDPQMLGAPTLESGFGLYSIRERLIAVGGSLRIESAAGTGTSVTAILPATLN